jgi:hypothetical protein
MLNTARYGRIDREAQIELEGSFDALGSMANGAGTATAFEMIKLLSESDDASTNKAVSTED